MKIRFMRAGTRELTRLLEMMRELQKDDPWEEAFEEGRVRADLEALLGNSSYGVAFIAWSEAEPVGYLVICFDYSLEYGGKGAWADELFVRAASRGLGIGTQLLDLAEEESRRAGARMLHLEVSHGNPAQELYRRRGFVEHGRFLMSKRLLD